jgi:hypothetical protein
MRSLSKDWFPYTLFDGDHDSLLKVKMGVSRRLTPSPVMSS